MREADNLIMRLVEEKMKESLLVSFCVLMLTACNPQGDDSLPHGESSSASETPVSSPVDYQSLTKVEAYELACATCHAEGVNGAPVPGNREDWADRSDLWDAVLLEHATSGYFAMPAKGGHEELPDFVVERAAEYMLEMTFPERRPD